MNDTEDEVERSNDLRLLRLSAEDDLRFILRHTMDWWQSLTHYNQCGSCEQCDRFRRYVLNSRKESMEPEFAFRNMKNGSEIFHEFNVNVDLKRKGMLNRVKTLFRLVKLSLKAGKVFKTLDEYFWIRDGERLVVISKGLDNQEYYQWVITNFGFAQQRSMEQLVSRDDFKTVFIFQDSVYPLYQLRGVSRCFVNNIKLFEAVPGAGKSYAVKQDAKGLMRSGMKVLVLVATREQKNDYDKEGIECMTIDAFINKFNLWRMQEDVYLDKKYKSEIYDECRQQLKISHEQKFFINKDNYVRIIIDEVFMMHAAQALFVAGIFYNQVVCYGDRGQIPVRSRTEMKFEHAMLSLCTYGVKQMNETHRCPRNVVHILSEVYPGIYTKSQKRGVHKVVLVNVANWSKMVSQEKEEHTQLLVFTRSEKEILNRAGKECLTVTEAQGLTFESVGLIRLHQFDVPLYTDIHQLTVAFSRHTDKLTYFTVKHDDISEILRNNKIMRKIEWNKRYTAKMKLVDTTYSWTESYDGPPIPVEVIRNTFLVERGFLGRLVNSITNQLKLYIGSYVEREKYSKEELSDALVTFTTVIELMFGYDTVDKDIAWLDMSEKELLKRLKKYDNIQVDETKFVEYYYKQWKDKKVVLRPKLLTGLRGRVPINAHLLVESLIKRNLDVSHLRDDFSTLDFDEIVVRFRRYYLRKDEEMGNYDGVDLRDLGTPFDIITEWLSSRNSRQVGKLMNTFDNDVIDPSRWNKYECFLKTTVKLKMLENESAAIIPVQVVTGANSISVMYFNICVKQMQNKLKRMLRDKFIYNDGLDVQELEQLLNNRLSKYRERLSYKHVKVIEMDYSKFDKNQDELMMLYQLMIFKEFGISDEVLVDYIRTHLDCELIFREAGIKVQVQAQRRTGDSFTYFGNTLMTMMMASYSFKEEDIICGVFGGDDSLVFVKDDAVVNDNSDFVAAAFNMELKYLRNDTSLMFASRFILVDNGRMYVYPDLLKLITRLFREDIATEMHLAAVTLSIKILMQDVSPQILTSLARVTAARYGKAVDEVYALFSSFKMLLEGNKISELYEICDEKAFYRKVSMAETIVLYENVFKRISTKQIVSRQMLSALSVSEKQFLKLILEIEERLQPVEEVLEGKVFLYKGVYIWNMDHGVDVKTLAGIMVDVVSYNEDKQYFDNYWNRLQSTE